MLLVNHLLDSVAGGGTAERTYQLARFLAKVGIDCTVLALDIGLSAERRSGLGSARIHAVPCINERYFVPRVSAEAIRGLVANADIVHLSGHWTILNALVYRACRRLNKPYLFCPAGALRPFGRSLAVKRLYDTLVGRQIVSSAAMCIAITEDERADFVARGVPRERVAVIPNGIDAQQYALDDVVRAGSRFREEIGVGSSPYVLFLGRLNEIKGPDLLLEAFARIADRFSDWHLVLAGPDGGMQRQLESFAELHGLAGRVHFAGFIGGSRKAAALRAAGLLAIPSRREAMSIVVLEAGACGCPVLFTDTCGLLEIAEDGAGVMVAPDVAGLAGGLAHALDDAKRRDQMARRLSEIVLAQYLWISQAERYATLCGKMVGGRAL